MNSISSQDSGINLSYHERDSSPADTIWRRNGHTNETREMNKKAAATNKKVELCTLVCKRDQENELADNLKQNLAKPRWHCPPKNIWKPTTDVSNYVCLLSWYVMVQ